MAGCGEIAKEMGVIAAEFDGIQLRSDWDQISKEIYEIIQSLSEPLLGNFIDCA